ncbi:MAG: hypothetical protein FJ102_18310 [Deltaproteobacteria bacterium]|nr:hypothetical protein [Deltaproteobacteria bacterium]
MHAARLVHYFDVFRHPLRVDELSRLVGLEDAELDSAVGEASRLGVERDGRWVFRLGRGADREARLRRARAAERLWKRARFAAATLARVPFVRGVLVTGSLSKQSASDDGDVDFLLVVATGRAWTVKSTLHGARRLLPGLARDSLCTNYILDEASLAIPERTMFTAVELATAVPMAGNTACVALLDANDWARRFVPGLEGSRARATLAPPIAPPSAVEARVPAAWDEHARAAMQRFWAWRYRWLDEQDRRKRFKQEAGVATNHLHDHSAWVAREFAARCEAHGVLLP